ncbi:TSUP family transporter [Streptomyces griseofuscus]|uniref:TSUP family transporter n=1 Tax=Streptomyces griseofuscus TaxID=146922 RepID=UPI0036A8190D
MARYTCVGHEGGRQPRTLAGESGGPAAYSNGWLTRSAEPRAYLGVTKGPGSRATADGRHADRPIRTPRPLLTGLRRRIPLLALLGAGGLAGAVAATFAPPRLITWGFVLYLAATLADVLVRPGFLSPAHDGPAGDEAVAVPAALGMLIGSLASFLGVGGSVLTVPLLRRSGLPMAAATALANPLTLCISAPACALFLTAASAAGGTVDTGALLLAAGSVDLGAVALLLLGGASAPQPSAHSARSTVSV